MKDKKGYLDVTALKSNITTRARKLWEKPAVRQDPGARGWELWNGNKIVYRPQLGTLAQIEAFVSGREEGEGRIAALETAVEELAATAAAAEREAARLRANLQAKPELIAENYVARAEYDAVNELLRIKEGKNEALDGLCAALYVKVGDLQGEIDGLKAALDREIQRRDTARDQRDTARDQRDAAQEERDHAWGLLRDALATVEALRYELEREPRVRVILDGNQEIGGAFFDHFQWGNFTVGDLVWLEDCEETESDVAVVTFTSPLRVELVSIDAEAAQAIENA